MSAEHWGYRTIGIVKGNRESFHPKHTMYPTDAGVTPSAGSDKWCTKWVNAETQPHIEKGIQEEFPDSERQLIVWREQVWHFFFFHAHLSSYSLNFGTVFWLPQGALFQDRVLNTTAVNP